MNWRARFVSCCSAAMLVGGVSACAADAPPPLGLHVTEAWLRPADSGRTAAVYFTLHSELPVADTLLGAATVEAATAGLHISIQRNRNMQMAHVTSLPVPPSDSVRFQPLGAHVMLEGLVRPMVEGDSVAMTLTFASGRALPFVAHIRRQ